MSKKQILFPKMAFLTIILLPLLLLSSGFTVAQGALKQPQPKETNFNSVGDTPPITSGRNPAQLRCCPCGCAEVPLTALMPASNVGLTLQAYPSFIFYLPVTVAQRQAEMVLLDENDNEIYTKTLTLPDTPQLLQITLSEQEGFPPLEVGKNYHWYFSIICNPDDRSGDESVDGWMRRVEVSEPLKSELAAASPHEQIAIYSQAGIWHEAVNTLFQLRQREPNNTTLLEHWVKLLNSVGLEAIAQQPLNPVVTDNQATRPPVRGGCH